jgi:ADP-ribosylglycohydrolase
MVPAACWDNFVTMLGAIVGDIAGSTYETSNFKFESCEIFRQGSRFTDDTVLTLATADCFVFGESYAENYRRFGRNYPNAGYGREFQNWLQSENPRPYNSSGNGAAMRASPIGWLAKDLHWALREAKLSAEVTHDHPSGIKGAQAIAAAVFLARRGQSKEEIRVFLSHQFGYELRKNISEIRPSYYFTASCEATVPVAIAAFLESQSFEDALRKAISVGGDSDTITSMAGAIAHAFYGEIPNWMIDYCEHCLDGAQLSILSDFWTLQRERK